MRINSDNDTWHTYSFDSSEAGRYLMELISILTDMDVDITNRAQLKEGFEKLFNVAYYHFPDLDERSYIIAPNHVSDFDALILGLIHPGIKILAKNDWVNDANLSEFMRHHYGLIGVDRESKISQARALVQLIRHLSAPLNHAMIFPQGTISDISKNSVERIQSGVFTLSNKSSVPVLPVFIEQPNFDRPTRIVFGKPMGIPDRKQDCREMWREAILSLASELNPPARSPVLTEKHANNNKPGDPFF